MDTTERRSKRMIGLAAFLCFLLVLPGFASAKDPVNLQLASFNVGSGWYTMAGAMAEILKKSLPSGSTVDALPKSGGIGNPMLLGAKKADLAFAFPMTANWAYNGKVIYEKPISNLRAVAGGLDSYWVAGAVKEDVGIDSWADLKAKKLGLRICTQSKGSLSELAAKQVLEAYGISYEDLKSWGGDILMTNFKDMVPALKEGALGGFLMMCTPNHPTWTELAISRPIKFISLEEPILETLKREYGYTRSVLPAGMFAGQKEDVVTIGFPTCLLAREDVPDDVIYTILKAIAENKERIQSSYGSFKAFDLKTAWMPDKLGGVPLHPGADRFYKEKGLK